MYMKIFELKLFYVFVENVWWFVLAKYYIELLNTDFLMVWDVFNISCWRWDIMISYFFLIKNNVIIKWKKKLYIYNF